MWKDGETEETEMIAIDGRQERKVKQNEKDNSHTVNYYVLWEEAKTFVITFPSPEPSLGFSSVWLLLPGISEQISDLQMS